MCFRVILGLVIRKQVSKYIQEPYLQGCLLLLKGLYHLEEITHGALASDIFVPSCTTMQNVGNNSTFMTARDRFPRFVTNANTFSSPGAGLLTGDALKFTPLMIFPKNLININKLGTTKYTQLCIFEI